MRCKVLILIFILFTFSSAISQTKREKEIRIDSEAFPPKALEVLTPYLTNSRRIRYYKEFDGNKVSYEIKFKKDRLKYSVEFNEDGVLEDVEYIVRPVDIPETTFEAISSYLYKNHKSYKIKKIQQQYLNQNNNSKGVLKAAFQNLILPEINYEIIVSSKDKKGFSEYEITFNSNGEQLSSRKAIKPKYDHVLY